MIKTAESFRERLAQAFKDSRYSDKYIAKYCNVSPAAVAKWKKTLSIKEKNLRAFCELHGIDFLHFKYDSAEILKSSSKLIDSEARYNEILGEIRRRELEIAAALRSMRVYVISVDLLLLEFNVHTELEIFLGVEKGKLNLPLVDFIKHTEEPSTKALIHAINRAATKEAVSIETFTLSLIANGKRYLFMSHPSTLNDFYGTPEKLILALELFREAPL